MDLGDLILLPIYVFILHLFFKRARKKYDDPILKKYHSQAFWVKIMGSVFFTIFYGIITGGDSFGLYHTEGKNIFDLILSDPQNIEFLFKPGSQFDLTLVKKSYNKGYFGGEANFMMIRLDAILSFLTFGRYAPINLLCAAIGFSGLWKLFLFFYGQYPHLHKQFALSILFFPSVVFWSSGLLKDTICMASLGWITYSVYEILFYKRRVFRNLILLLFFGRLLMVLKVYILLAYLPFLILFIILKNVKSVKNSFVKLIVAPTLILLAIFAFSQAMSSFDNELGVYAIDEVTTSISTLNENLSQKNGDADAASNFSLGTDFEPTFYGLIKIAPYAITATFFRPFLWEASKITQMLAALESLVLIFFTLIILLRAGPFQFIRIILRDPLIMYCFLFAIVFGLFVGASTVNFGTLVRYKIPCLPFFAISLFLVYEKVKEKAALKAMARQTNNQTTAPTLIPAIAG